MEFQNEIELEEFIIKIGQGVFCKQNGLRLKLHPKEFSLFCLLVKHSGQLVTKEQIINQIWHGEPATDECLARCVYSLRSCLRTCSERADELIKVEYGRGYCFVGNIMPLKQHTIQFAKSNKPNISRLSDIVSRKKFVLHARNYGPRGNH
jgi:DNA-binding winged helix-turn-helix (wHTH) protein